MKKFNKIGVVAVLAAAITVAFYSLANAPRLESPVAAQATQTERDAEAMRQEFRKVVLKHIEMGETVTVENDRIGYLEGAVKLVPIKRPVPEMEQMTKSRVRMPKILTETEIATIAGRLRDPAAREGLTTFARTASEGDKYVFLNIGRTIYLDDYKAGPKTTETPQEDPKKKCYDSCQTLCHIVTTTPCKWDCRIVNNEKVCTESCTTIAKEVCNVVCKKTCD